MSKYLEKVNSPKDLKALSDEEVILLADEIRDFLVESVSRTGGHLASNLGVVELTLALHRVFDSPTDRIIFDVGHQSYVHKILTGRREKFDYLRVPGGLSGFTSRRESEHDPFGAGHSSTALSAALGFVEADALDGVKRHTVAVIGDGAYTGGMVHEALNNCKEELPLVIILNENGMSISSNKGAFARYLAGVRISSGYRKWKTDTNNFLSKLPLVGKPLRRFLSFSKEKIKGIIYKQNYFEQLGLYYIGPIDGNNYEKCVRALTEAKSLGKTVIVHVKTQKGRGYAPAEESPDGYHSVAASGSAETFHSAFANQLCSIAEERDDIVAVTAAMGKGTGLESFGEKYPKRYFDVGIAEEHAITFSAGLAAAGKKPFVAIYSTFLQRGYDNVLHDIALQDLPVKLMIDRAGLAVSDGATHHGIFDVAYLSHIPEISLMQPMTFASLRRMTEYAVESDSPVAIRYPNTSEMSGFEEIFTHVGNGVHLSFDPSERPDYLFVTYGQLTEQVVSAALTLEDRERSVGIAVLEILKPLEGPFDVLSKYISSARRTVICEEGIKRGGVGEAIEAMLVENGIAASCRTLAVDDNFAVPQTPSNIYEAVGLSPNHIVRAMTEGLYDN